MCVSRFCPHCQASARPPPPPPFPLHHRHHYCTHNRFFFLSAMFVHKRGFFFAGGAGRVEAWRQRRQMPGLFYLAGCTSFTRRAKQGDPVQLTWDGEKKTLCSGRQTHTPHSHTGRWVRFIQAMRRSFVRWRRGCVPKREGGEIEEAYLLSIEDHYQVYCMKTAACMVESSIGALATEKAVLSVLPPVDIRFPISSMMSCSRGAIPPLLSSVQ